MLCIKDAILKFRIAPGAVCRILLARLQDHEPLSKTDNDRILDAIKSTGIPDVELRLVADASRDTLNAILNEI